MADVNVARVRIFDLTITDNADTYQTLLTAKDDPNMDLATDGSNVAECARGARLVDINLQIQFWNQTAGDRTELMLYRDPDAMLTTQITPSLLFNPDVSLTGAHVKSATMYYQPFQFFGSGTGTLAIPRIRRGAMARNRKMKENDNLRLLFSNNDAGATRKVNIVGRITWAK